MCLLGEPADDVGRLWVQFPWTEECWLGLEVAGETTSRVDPKLKKQRSARKHGCQAQAMVNYATRRGVALSHWKNGHRLSARMTTFVLEMLRCKSSGFGKPL